MTTFGKDDIYKLIRTDQKLNEEFSSIDDSFESLNNANSIFRKRLKSILDLLRLEKVKRALDFYSQGFYSERLKGEVEQSQPNLHYTNYQYSPLAVLFLATLISEYDDTFFKVARGSKKEGNLTNPEELEQDWLDKCNGRLITFKSFWDENGEGLSWTVVLLNLQFVFKGIVMIVNAEDKSNIVDERLARLTKEISYLPIDAKIEFYNQIIRRIATLEKKLEDYIANLPRESKGETDPNRPNTTLTYEYYLTNKRLDIIDEKIENGEEVELPDGVSEFLDKLVNKSSKNVK